MIESPVGVMTVLVGTAALFFWLERATGWVLFRYLVPLIWIYAVPMLLRNVGLLPVQSASYDVLRSVGLPVVIVLLLVDVDVGAAVRIMGRGIGVMLLGTVGIVIGAPIGYWSVHRWLEPDAWKGFAALSGSWIGGTGNLAAVGAGVDVPADMFGLAVLADSAIYVAWLPLLLVSRGFADRFNRWTGVSEGRMERMDAAAADAAVEAEPVKMVHFLYLGLLGLAVTWGAQTLAPRLPESSIVSTSTWLILLVTAGGIALSFTPARRIPGSHDLAMARALRLRRADGGDRVARGAGAGAGLPARRRHLDHRPRPLRARRGVLPEGRRPLRRHRLGGQRGRRRLGAGRRRLSPPEPGAGVDPDGADRLRDRQSARPAGGGAVVPLGRRRLTAGG